MTGLDESTPVQNGYDCKTPLILDEWKSLRMTEEDLPFVKITEYKNEPDRSNIRAAEREKEPKKFKQIWGQLWSGTVLR